MHRRRVIVPVGTVVLDTPRKFSLWGYRPRFDGGLLLRSHPGGLPTRLDFFIQGPTAMDIRTYFEGVRVEVVEGDYLDQFPSKPRELDRRDMEQLAIYAFYGNGWNGFVLGSSYRIVEDDGAADGPSSIFRQGWDLALD